MKWFRPRFDKTVFAVIGMLVTISIVMVLFRQWQHWFPILIIISISRIVYLTEMHIYSFLLNRDSKGKSKVEYDNHYDDQSEEDLLIYLDEDQKSDISHK